MSIIELPLESVPPDQLGGHIDQLKEYLRTAVDPNETGANGHTCVSLAMGFCRDDPGIELLRSLLANGGDPNLPVPLQNFQTYMMVAKSATVLELLIDAGLRINDVYAGAPGMSPLPEGAFTMLDYAYGIRAYLNRNRKPLSALATKFAGGGFGSRRRFVDETIALLEAQGAQRSSKDAPA